MTYAVENIAKRLKATRKAKGLSQTVLGKTVGLPQSHISKIESGTVDLNLSTLLEIARALDLEPVLVPRKLLPAIQSLVRGARDQSPGAMAVDHSFGESTKPAYSLDEEDDDA